MKNWYVFFCVRPLFHSTLVELRALVFFLIIKPEVSFGNNARKKRGEKEETIKWLNTNHSIKLFIVVVFFLFISILFMTIFIPNTQKKTLTKKRRVLKSETYSRCVIQIIAAIYLIQRFHFRMWLLLRFYGRCNKETLYRYAQNITTETKPTEWLKWSETHSSDARCGIFLCGFVLCFFFSFLSKEHYIIVYRLQFFMFISFDVMRFYPKNHNKFSSRDERTNTKYFVSISPSCVCVYSRWNHIFFFSGTSFYPLAFMKAKVRKHFILLLSPTNPR